MERLPLKKTERIGGEKVQIWGKYCGKYRVFAVFIICTAILTAAFAMVGIVAGTDTGRAWLDGFLGGSPQKEAGAADETHESTDSAPKEDAAAETPQGIPENAIPVIGMDLSCTSHGEGYYLNETGYRPDIENLIAQTLTLSKDEVHGSAPLVLILHTHTQESYLDEGCTYVEGALSDATFSKDADQNMIAVGRALCNRLAEKGIPALHCTVDHMKDGRLQGSYDRAAESIANYLRLYPSIRLVIDLHRDAVLTRDGAYIKSEGGGDGNAAQILPVVGTDGNGTEHPNWERNLSLALQLQRALNSEEEGICRPVLLRSASYNQEMAPYALLLEIGTGGNSLEQAKRTAQMLGDALCVFFQTDQTDQTDQLE